MGSLEHGQPQDIEAIPGARWDRVDLFKSYGAPAGKPTPHTAFLGLRKLHRAKGKHEIFDKALLWFVGTYGLLGLMGESFGFPSLPEHLGWFGWIAPDTVLDGQRRLKTVNPSTEGRELLEDHLGTRLDSVVVPEELSFSSHRLTGFGLMEPLTGAARTRTYSWEEVRDLYGVRAVFDEGTASGVSLLSTHEPLTFWDLEIENFPVPPCTAELFNARTRDVSPRAVPGKDGRLGHSWRCSALLSAMYMMLFLDQTGDIDIRKCQAPDCPEYFRVAPGTERRKPRMYCYHPDDPRKRSRCAGRVESQKSRDRKGRKS